MGKVILVFLSDLPEMIVVGEAATLPEAVMQAGNLHPDAVVLDLNICGGIARKAHLCSAKIVTTSLHIDHESKILAESMGAAKLLDKMELASELIPAILELRPLPSRS
jgi:DNA-binding NarL/FixJ family response regulator